MRENENALSPEHSVRCTSCGHRVAPIRPHFGWKIAVYAAWIGCTVLLIGAVMTVVGMIALGPLLIFIGGPILGYVYTRAYQEPHCPDCGVMMTFPTRARLRRERHEGSTAGGLIEGST